MPILTTEGTPTLNGNSTCTINSTDSDRVLAPINLIDESQSWFAARVVCPTVHASLLRHTFSWKVDSNNHIIIYLGNSGQSGSWRLKRMNAASSNEASTSHGTEGADTTVIGRWTATQLAISRDGASFATQADTNIPDLAAGDFDIGQSIVLNYLGTALYWCAAGTGTLTDSDASTIHAFGNADPAWVHFPPTAQITFLWTADTFYYQDTGPSYTTVKIR